MQFQHILAGLTLLGSAVAAPAPDYAELVKRQYPVKACSHITGGLHVIALGGANTNYQKDYGLLGSLSRSILAAIPGSTNVSMPYNKVLTPSNPPKLQPGAVADGMKLLKQYVVNYHHACPNTKIALIGYSSGGVILMNDLCYGGNGQGTPQMNPLIAGNVVVAAVTYGQETRVGGQSYNQGTCPPQYSAIAPRADPSRCAAYAPYIRDYCDNLDPDCCVNSGDDVNVHFGYPAKYDAEATQYIKDRFYAAGGP